MLASSLPMSMAWPRSPDSARPCARRNSTSFLRRLLHGQQPQRLLEVALRQPPVVAGLETVAELDQRLPAQPRVAPGRLQLLDRLVDQAAAQQTHADLVAVAHLRGKRSALLRCSSSSRVLISLRAGCGGGAAPRCRGGPCSVPPSAPGSGGTARFPGPSSRPSARRRCRSAPARSARRRGPAPARCAGGRRPTAVSTGRRWSGRPEGGREAERLRGRRGRAAPTRRRLAAPPR